MSTDIISYNPNVKIEKIFNQMPDIPLWVCKAMYNFGKALLDDDAHDIGYFQYYNRIGVTYHGKKSTNHPSAFHHWQPAVFMIITSQLLTILHKAKEVYTVYKEADELFEDEEDMVDKNNVVQIKGRVIEDRKIPELPALYY